ncbi:hypothetical protein BDN71DRAFT_1534917, partial [Pleurotus eryngii]
SFLNTTTITQITRYAAWYAPHIDYKAALEAGATISDMRHRDVPRLAHLIIIYLSVEAEGFVLSNGEYLCHLTIQILEDTQCCCIMIYTEPVPIEPLDLPANYIQIRRAAVAAAIFRRYVLNCSGVMRAAYFILALSAFIVAALPTEDSDRNEVKPTTPGYRRVEPPKYRKPIHRYY